MVNDVLNDTDIDSFNSLFYKEEMLAKFKQDLKDENAHLYK